MHFAYSINPVYSRISTLSWTTSETNTFTGHILTNEGQMEVDWGDSTKEVIDSGIDNLTHDYGGLSGDKVITVLFVEGYKDVYNITLDYTNSKGDISNWPISKFVNISYLYIQRNNFTGDLSEWNLSNLSNLSRFKIDRNSFTGSPLNWGIGQLDSLKIFNISNNSFEADLSDLSLPLSPNYFILDYNYFTGDLSGWDLGEEMGALDIFEINNNNFTSPPGLRTETDNWLNVNLNLANNTDFSASEIGDFIISLDTYDGEGGQAKFTGCNGGSMTYSDLSTEAQTAHDNLINNKNWTIEMD